MPVPVPFASESYRRLGRTELRVSPIALGGAWLGQIPDGYDPDAATATVIHALNLGINLIDTSPLYGDSEIYIGKALDAWYAQSGKRGDILLSSKTGTRQRPPNFSADHTRSSIDITLKRLRTDYLDICHIHDPLDIEDPLRPGAAFEVLQDLQRQGIVRHIGLGARPHAYHQRFIATGRTGAQVTFTDFHLVRQTAREGVLRHAIARDVGILLASVLAYGVLGGGDPRVAVKQHSYARSSANATEFAQAVAMWEWCQARDIDLLTMNLQYCLAEPGVSALLLGASQPEHLDADLVALQAPVSAALWTEFRSTFGL